MSWAAAQTAFADIVIALLRDEPDQWSGGNYTLDHAPTGFEVWVGNGFFFLELCRPEQVSFTFVQKLRAWYYIRRIRRALAETKQQQELERLHNRLSALANNVVSLKSRRKA